MPAGSGSWYPRSFLLTDIVGSVGLWERDPSGMSVAVARHDVLVAEAVAAAGGELIRTKGEGDSTFSVFTHPVEAVTAAEAVQHAIAAEDWPAGLGLRARAGVHTGDAERREGDWYGPAVNRAARLRALAGGGQTLVSGVTAGLAADQLPSDMHLLYRGRRTLRGIERPEEVWELVRPGDPRLAAASSARPGGLPASLTSFVGHGGDVDRLVELVERERLVTLTGPGGSGKTRLAMEAAGALAGRGEAVRLAELAAVCDGDHVAQAVAVALDVETGLDPLESLGGEGEGLAGVQRRSSPPARPWGAAAGWRASPPRWRGRTRPGRPRRRQARVGGLRISRVAPARHAVACRRCRDCRMPPRRCTVASVGRCHRR